MKHIRHCVISPNHTYEYCSKCRRFDPKETWMNMFCSMNCKTIFSIVANYNDKMIDKDEAKTQLEQCQLGDLDTYTESIRNAITEILS